MVYDTIILDFNWFFSTPTIFGKIKPWYNSIKIINGTRSSCMVISCIIITHTLGFSDMSSTINKPTSVCLKMFGNANGSWSIFQLKIAIRWLIYGWSRCRNGTNPQYLSGILLFPCFLWSCRNHVRTVASYPYHMIYIYNLSPCNIPRLIVTSLFGWTKNRIDFIDLHWKSLGFPVNVPIQS